MPDPNPFRPKPQRRFDPHRFERLSNFLEANSIDWETYLGSLLTGRAPAPFIYGSDIYLDRSDVSSFRGHLRAESLRRVAELMDKTEILAPEAT
jgi:hypothetical protein